MTTQTVYCAKCQLSVTFLVLDNNFYLDDYYLCNNCAKKCEVKKMAGKKKPKKITKKVC